jgi:hypothetical protein
VACGLRLFDLGYMKRFYAERLLRISEFHNLLAQTCLKGYSQTRTSRVFRKSHLQDLKQFAEDCKDLGLLVSRAETNRLITALETHDLTTDNLVALSQTILKVLESELSASYFLKINPEYSELVLPLPHFGEPVSRVFSSARMDINEASACLALERYQACVFHSMLALEHGLRWMCAELSIGFPTFEQWGKIIKDIEDAISLLNIPKSDAAGRERREILAGAASHFRMVKDGWRNHVTHGRGAHYGPEATEAIYRSVRQIMIELAEYEESKKL